MITRQNFMLQKELMLWRCQTRAEKSSNCQVSYTFSLDFWNSNSE
jgi:hypothetical protein